MRTTRLSELVHHGRQAVRAGGAGAVSSDATPPPPVVKPQLSQAPRAQPWPRVRDDVVDKIELLAIQLLSISKSKKAEPEALLREALMSIEECIVAIGSRH